MVCIQQFLCNPPAAIQRWRTLLFFLILRSDYLTQSLVLQRVASMMISQFFFMSANLGVEFIS